MTWQTIFRLEKIDKPEVNFELFNMRFGEQPTNVSRAACLACCASVGGEGRVEGD